jgi:hypothetical protein
MATGETGTLAIRRDDDQGGRPADAPGRRARGKPRGKSAGKTGGPKLAAEIQFDEAVLIWLNVQASATGERRSAIVNRAVAGYLKRSGVHAETYRPRLPKYLEDGKTEAA